ncbi:low molecular weight phosphotyrosine protein phosphatase [Paraburkholderia unamae]|nr:low molecular weight phosphotyrosine protein phosphatase [Paraburkholderia unamae]
MISNVLIVCHANVCRSPIAEELFRRRAGRICVVSAGIEAEVGYPAASGSISVLSEIGLDISAHRAQQCSQQMIRDADLILAMSSEQVEGIEARYPLTRGKIFRIGESLGIDISDPIGLPIDRFRECRETLSLAVDYWVRSLDLGVESSELLSAGDEQ